MINKFLNIRLVNYAIALFLLCFVTLIVQTQAQVVVDSRSAGGAFSNTGVTSLSWTHTVGSGTNRALFVGVSITNQVATAPVCSPAPCPPNTLPSTPLPAVNFSILSATDNGVAMTFDGGGGFTPSGSGITVQTAIYRLVNPPSGANNIVVTFTPGVVTHGVGNSVSFNGVNQITPTSNTIASVGNSTSPTLTVSGTGVTANDMVFDILASTPNAGFFVQGPEQTVCTDPADETTCTRGRRFFFTAYDVGASSTEPGNPAGVTMSWTMTTAQPWVLAATVVKAAPPPTAASVSIGGRVISPFGRGLGRVYVKLTEANGTLRTVRTNSFGYFRFDDLPAGQTVTIEVFSRRFNVDSQTLTINEDIEQLNITAQP